MELRRRSGLSLPIRLDPEKRIYPDRNLRKGHVQEKWGRLSQIDWQFWTGRLSRAVTTMAVYAAALLFFLLLLGYWRQVYIRGSFRSSRIPMPQPPPVRTYRQLLEFIQTHVRQERQYEPILPVVGDSDSSSSSSYNLLDCPPTPPPGYPQDFPVMDVLNHWPTDDIPQQQQSRSTKTKQRRMIHQGICVFDYSQLVDREEDPVAVQQFAARIQAYRRAEVPYVIRGDETILRTAERWSDHDYMRWLLQDKVFRGEVSTTNSIMYWNIGKGTVVPPDFVPPTTLRPFTFDAWYKIASQKTSVLPNETHAYLRLDACLATQPYCDKSHGYRHTGLSGVWYLSRVDDANFLWQELPFFNPAAASSSDPYLILPDGQRGINCRFGMPGAVAEMHFDSDRNFIALLGGERRYILAHPRNCPNMYLYEQHHPMERHSAVDWSAPDLTAFPDFDKVRVNELVLQAGDVLYLPTQWFHHIISLTVNYQCNTRSGWTTEYEDLIQQCGFNYGE